MVVYHAATTKGLDLGFLNFQTKICKSVYVQIISYGKINWVFRIEERDSEGPANNLGRRRISRLNSNQPSPLLSVVVVPIGYLSILIDQNRSKSIIIRNRVIDFYRRPIFVNWLVSNTIDDWFLSTIEIIDLLRPVKTGPLWSPTQGNSKMVFSQLILLRNGISFHSSPYSLFACLSNGCGKR